MARAPHGKKMMKVAKNKKKKWVLSKHSACCQCCCSSWVPLPHGHAPGCGTTTMPGETEARHGAGAAHTPGPISPVEPPRTRVGRSKRRSRKSKACGRHPRANQLIPARSRKSSYPRSLPSRNQTPAPAPRVPAAPGPAGSPPALGHIPGRCHHHEGHPAQRGSGLCQGGGCGAERVTHVSP